MLPVHRARTTEGEFYFTLPETFDAADSLPRNLRRHRHNAEYLVSTVLTKLSRCKGRKSVRLLSTHLKRMMGDRYAEIIDALSGTVVHRVGGYEVGRQCYGYTLDNRFTGDSHVRKPVTNAPMLKRLKSVEELRDEERQRRLLPVHQRLFGQQTRLEIDSATAHEILRQKARANRFDGQGILVRDIEDGQFRFTVGRYGRVANNITSLRRTVRRTLHVDGDPLIGVDLRCAQPALLGLLIWVGSGKCHSAKTHNISSYHCCCLCPPALSSASVSLFLECVQSGTLYEELMAHVPADVSRSKVKRLLLTDVFAKRGRYHSVVEDAFRELFPEVHAFIREINRDDHASLIRLLQRLESHLVIEQVCGQLTVNYPELFLITLHDAIYSTEDGVPLIVDAFQAQFRELAFPMKLKVERPASAE